MANKAVPKKTGNTVAAAAKKAVETTGKAAKAAAAKAAAGAVKPEPEQKIQKDPHIFSDLDQYLFGQATHYELYKKMGAHTAVVNGEPGTWFTVWAPNAVAVYVIGEFNCWNEKANPMKKIADMGIFEIFVPGAEVGQMYKYLIIARDGRKLYKADPYAFWAEKRPGTASRIADISYKWGDVAWLKNREKFTPKMSALSIYEVHPGSWMKHPYSEENPEGFYNYREFAKRIVEYVKDMGYTHVELMGIAEHPLDASWGYQVTGYYAPTSRYGTPQDFKYLVDYLHKNRIGVILDWVPAHFPKDEQGLAEFDGDAVYEHADPRQGEHPDWGTKIFNYGRPEVKNFLLANALYWVEEYHIDGLRVDAVASMLYLDYGRKDGEWIPNKYGGNQNLEAIEFFKHLNSLVTGRNHGVMMIAEESTAWPKVTGSVEDDGLGFTFKWNMGWMHDFLEYMQLDPYFRKFNHNKMTFAMTYAFSENYILVLSHDEVVHLKRSMISKMPGEDEEKFENLKAGYTYMFGHPGKKLLFMGQDIGQYREWSEEREIDWFLLRDKKNEHLQAYVRDLLMMYKKYKALYANDSGYEGFSWINANDADRSIFSFIRWSPTGRDNLVFIMSFTPVAHPDFVFGVPEKKTLKLILDSCNVKYGGDHSVPDTYKALEGECDNQPYHIAYDLPPFGAAVFKF
ncbi:1,4-alpha-glucan branching protein GlgB [Bilifractor porci]|uniref:1,4-alpha-glucan branching enzyme GlgB n=1 Tax=Bilifractor porci TaxID=2606636 RepID=A0A7X2P7D4_9FIRM|nr:1,4-alpha-glucan branching protein GlgB [Bilifractor porci]MST81604.1 1,4-alpha-glucan branching protein GlgB [Bilifractor porci]